MLKKSFPILASGVVGGATGWFASSTFYSQSTSELENHVDQKFEHWSTTARAEMRAMVDRKLADWKPWRRMPKRIILVRHGESEANVDPNLYGLKGDLHICLTPTGWQQGVTAGNSLRELVGDESVRFFSSPYVRTRETLAALSQAWGGIEEVEWTEHPVLREQESGRISEDNWLKAVKEMKQFGHFFYRFPHGESQADVSDRVWQFGDILHRYFRDRPETQNYVVVSHAVFNALFIAKVLHLPVDDLAGFEMPNACYAVLESKPTPGHRFGDEQLVLTQVTDSVTGRTWRPEEGHLLKWPVLHEVTERKRVIRERPQDFAEEISKTQP